MPNPETRYARSPEGHVAYQVVGDAPRDLVFVSSWVNNVEVMWEGPSLARFLRRLSTFSRLICFDKRGTGVSDPVPLNALPTLEQWCDDVRVVMGAVGSQRAALLGHAPGGQMAMLFAATFPQQTTALILVDSCARTLRDIDYPWGYPPRFLTQLCALAEERWGTAASLDVSAPSVAHDDSFKRWYARYERLSMGPKAAAAMYAAFAERDLRSVLSSISVPTLVLHRAGNRFAPVGHGRYLAHNIPGAKYVELPGTDHIVHVGDQDAMLGEIEEFLTGVRSPTETDRALATIMFTDIVGSTEQAIARGDREWRELLDHHDSLVKQQLERFRGRLLRSTGDGILAIFDGPARAIQCAVAIRNGVNNLGISIRTGLHTGEVQARGDNVDGIAFHIGARVSALAQGGEVLVSSTVKDLVAGSGLLFTDRGSHGLKGLPGEWRVFAVKAAA